MGASLGTASARGRANGWVLAVVAALATACGGGSEGASGSSGGGFGAAAPLAVDPATGAEFSAQGGTILLGGPFEYVLTNPGDAALPWSASTSAAWVNVVPSSGTLAPGGSTTVLVSLATSGLAGLGHGTHQTVVHFDDPVGGGDTDRTVTLVWAPGASPLLTLEPIQAFTAAGTIGGPFTPASKTYVVRNIGTVDAPWSVSTTLSWLSFQGSTSGVLAPGAQVSLVATYQQSHAAGLAVGTHTGSLVFTNVGTGQALPLPFSVEVLPQPAALSVTPGSLSFQVQVQGSLPATKALLVRNNGGQSAGFSVGTGAAWLTANPTSGTLAPGQQVQVNVGLLSAATNLAVGTHNAAITVLNTTNGVGNASVPVALTVQAAPASLAVTPFEGAAFASSTPGSVSPPFKQYTVANTGGSPLVWSASANQGWIAVSNPGGTLAPGAQTTLAVSVLSGAAQSLPPGVAQGSLVVTNVTNGTGGGSVPVSLTKGVAPSMAINLNGLSYYSPELPFVDLFRTAHDWLPQEANGFAWNTGQPLAKDANGWISSLAPGQAAGTLLARDIDGQYPGGVYTLLFQGKGTFTAALDGQIVQVQPGRILVNVTPSNAGVHLKLTSTDPTDPVRNIRFVMPGHEATHLTHPWNPAFLDVIAPFGGLRFMDWQRTNHSTQQHWADRPTPQTVTQATVKGCSVEFMVDLCNTAKKDAWFCMPHLATDDYVAKFATYVRDNLDPTLKVYVELSNEVWNGIFSQSQWAAQQGSQLYPGVNAFQAQLRAYSKRAVEMFDIWTSVFGQQSHRVVRTLAGQMNPWTGTEIMDWQQANTKADAYAIAPYFGGSLGDPGQQAATAAMTVSQILDACEAALPAVGAQIAQNAQNAAARGLALVAYEGGQHLVGHGGAENNTTLTAKFIEANRHSRMRDIYLAYLDIWRQSGGEVFFHFNAVCTPSKWGAWGALERLTSNKATSPKYAALVEFNALHPAWW